MENLNETDSSGTVTVYYDGGCPVCSREIGWYRRSRGADCISWVDVHSEEFANHRGIDRERALARFHVRRADGGFVDGAAAFRELWAQLPAWQWLARMTKPAAISALLERCYDGFLVWRNGPRVRALAYAKMPLGIRRDLRSNHAGELGAVWIYRGILTAARGREVRQFARRHLATEQTHLALMREIVPLRGRSLLSLVWAAAGYVTGLIAALAGANAVYITIDAVETFVDKHYRAQLETPHRDGLPDHVRRVLERCHEDELAHRDEARQLAKASGNRLLGLWTSAIAEGSNVAVRVARAI